MVIKKSRTFMIDLVNSPGKPSSKEYCNVTQTSASKASASKTIHSALNPVKSLMLNVSVGEISQIDSLCELINPPLVADPIK